jgi:hypothetical protein
MVTILLLSSPSNDKAYKGCLRRISIEAKKSQKGYQNLFQPPKFMSYLEVN